MALQILLEDEGAIDHLLSRGDRRGNIFRDEADSSGFLASLAAAYGETGWQAQ